MITIRQYLIWYLQGIGADGLCGDDCGCDITDLAPCDSAGCLDCVPAKKGLGGLYFPLDNQCFWKAYQADPSYENCCRWLKHRAWVHLDVLGGCPK